MIYSDKWRGYDGLVDVGYDKHFRVNHGNNEFAKGMNHINEIEASYAKMRLYKFRGLSKDKFNLHLKECEFRFNNRNNDLFKILIKEFENKPLN